MSEATDRAEIEANWAAQLEGMDQADTELLASQFTPDARLVHMTGYSQPLDEWMAGIRRREFVYHRLEEHSHTLTIGGDTARLVGRITTGITDDGSGQAWPLNCEQSYRRTDDGWLCTRSKVGFGH